MYSIKDKSHTGASEEVYDLAEYTTGKPEDAILAIIDELSHYDGLIIRVYHDKACQVRAALAVWNKGDVPKNCFDDPDVRADLRNSFM